MKVSFVWMWPYRILIERAQKECSWRVVHVLLQISWIWMAGALRVIIAALATSRASTQTTLKPSSSSWQHFLFASCVVCWWHEVWAPFQGRRTTLSLRILGREHCFAVTRRCFLRTKSKKLFPSGPSTGFASRRFSCWQSENQKDSRLGRVRIIISDRTCALLNAQQIKMVSREACVCAMWSRTGQGLHVCMRAYLRNLLGTAAHCRPNPCCGTAFVQFFCSLFVNLLCRKPEIESLGFNVIDWFLSGGLLGQARLARTSESQINSRQQNERLERSTMPNPSGYPAFVWLLRRSCPSEGNTSAAAHRTATSLWLRSNSRRCTSESTPHLHAPPAMFIEVTSAMHIQNKLFPQLGRGVLEPLYTTTSASSSWSRPRNICSACLSRWHLPRRSPPFIWLGPQPTQKCWQQWPTNELTPSRKRLLPPAWWTNDDGACLRLAHAQVENENWNPGAAAPGAVEGRAWVP